MTSDIIIPSDIGRRIRTARMEANMTQKEMAELIGIKHQGTLSKWELSRRGGPVLRISHIREIEKTLGTSLLDDQASASSVPDTAPETTTEQEPATILTAKVAAMVGKLIECPAIDDATREIIRWHFSGMI